MIKVSKRLSNKRRKRTKRKETAKPRSNKISLKVTTPLVIFLVFDLINLHHQIFINEES
jgi:hypothetical protein